ncbi:MAG: VWA domain-containing protein [Acidobacteriota bacterium]
MRFVAAFILLVLSTVLPVSAAVEVWIEKPRSAKMVSGVVEVVAVAAGDEEVASVEFVVDGVTVAQLSRPPFAIKVDVGDENREHEFRVIARSPEGTTATAVVTTPALAVDDSLEIELQQLYVTVTDAGRRVLNLQRGDFRIIDDGVQQEIVTFESGEVPITAAVLLDCSLSMKGERLEAALQGADTFLQGMQSLDRATVMLFSDRLLRATQFTDDQQALRDALAGVSASGGTSINDHLYIALTRLEQRQGRRVIVLFSDGTDVQSVLSMKDVLEKARRSRVLIYWIHLRKPGDSDVPAYTTPWRNVDANREEFRTLIETIVETGGRIEEVVSVDGLDEAFAGILAELREQYVLGYYPTRAVGDGSWHEVRVKLGKPGSVRAREGYIDY